MSDCCSQTNTGKTVPKKQSCPINEQDYIRVPVKTILHHIKESWNCNLKDQGYYFCTDPDCDVVYFGEDGTQITTSSLRTRVGIKVKKTNAVICYCFGVSREDINNNANIKDFVIEQTKIKNCSCETSNPSGRCCLKDF